MENWSTAKPDSELRWRVELYLLYSSFVLGKHFLLRILQDSLGKIHSVERIFWTDLPRRGSSSCRLSEQFYASALVITPAMLKRTFVSMGVLLQLCYFYIKVVKT